MLTKIVEFASAAVLLAPGILVAVCRPSSAAHHSIVCGGSILAAHHAIRAQKRFMAWEVLGLALLFNPLVPCSELGTPLSCPYGSQLHRL
jgi:hypothetical protein